MNLLTRLGRWWAFIVTHWFHGSLPEVPAVGSTVTLPGIAPNPAVPALPASHANLPPTPTPVVPSTQPVGPAITPVNGDGTNAAGTLVTNTAPPVQHSDYGTPDENGYAVCLPLEAARQQAIADGFEGFANSHWPQKIICKEVAASILPGELRVRAEWLVVTIGTGVTGMPIDDTNYPNPKGIEQGFVMVPHANDPALPDDAPTKWHYTRDVALANCVVFGPFYDSSAKIVAKQNEIYLAHRNDPVYNGGGIVTHG